MNPIKGIEFSLEPGWQQSEAAMIHCLYKATSGLYTDSWSSSNWALWEIARLRKRIDDLGAYVDELEEKATNAD